MELRISLPFSSLRVGSTIPLAVLVAALFALLPVAAAPAATRAKAPTITSVSPMKALVGERLTIRGRNFRAGKGRNTVVFKRDGGRALFVKTDLSTRKLIRVTVPARLESLLPLRDGARQYAQFRVRVLSARLGRSFTTLSRSPRLGMPIAADADCDADGRTNRTDTDDDNDLLADSLEARYRLLECDADSDDDGVGDGYEFASARDLNDDDYQGPNTALPYPGSRPYPNPLDRSDADSDFDGDSLTLSEEHALWRFTLSGRPGDSGPALNDAAYLGRFDLLDALSYSDGEQHSIRERCPSVVNPGACGPRDAGRRVPALAAVGYDRHEQFLTWAQQAGYRTVYLTDDAPWWLHGVTRAEYGLFDVDRSHDETPSEVFNLDRDRDGYLSDEERDEDADGLTNFDETHGRMRPSYWTTCYKEERPHRVAYAGTEVTDPDSDGDTIRDGADDQDHDDVPNLMELSRIAASHIDDRHPVKGACTPADGLLVSVGSNGEKLPVEVNHPSAYGRVNPFNPCLPLSSAGLSRTCQRIRELANPPAPFDDSPNWFALQ